jgi:hypothetical protein
MQLTIAQSVGMGRVVSYRTLSDTDTSVGVCGCMRLWRCGCGRVAWAFNQ